jgi:hypothetical protein
VIVALPHIDPESVAFLPFSYIRRVLSLHSFKSVALPRRRFSSFLQPVKDDLGLKRQGVYNIPREYGEVYMAQTGHLIPTLGSITGTYKLNFRTNQPWPSTASIWDIASSSRTSVSSPIN